MKFELIRGGFYTGGNDPTITYNLEEFLQYPLRLYEQDNVDRRSSVVLREETYIDLFETPKPKNFTKIHPYEHRWITEINFDKQRLPRHFQLGNWIVRDSMILSEGARIGIEGIAYFCPSPANFGGDIDKVLVRPTLFIPSAVQIFERLFKNIGFDSKLSDKGFYSQDAIAKFGNLEVIGQALRDTEHQQLFNKYLDQIKPAAGIQDEGALLTDKRRYLNFPSLKKLIGSDEQCQRVLEFLIQAQVLYRGFIFKCRFCKNADWFDLGEVTQTFKCKRCNRSQHILAENYRFGNEPNWNYKLDEIVYQFFRNDGYVTVLALDNLRRTAESFLYCHDLDLIKPDAQVAEKELDILCIREGILTLGEAKKENRLGETNKKERQEIQKYYELAQKIEARSLVFATYAESWSEQTQNNIREIVTDKRIGITLLTKADLLSG